MHPQGNQIGGYYTSMFHFPAISRIESCRKIALAISLIVKNHLENSATRTEIKRTKMVIFLASGFPHEPVWVE